MRRLFACCALGLVLTGCGSSMSPTGTPSGVATGGEAGREEVMLPIGTIYNQGNTMWCWAFSAFHTLRTYYFNNTSTDPGVSAWRDAMRSIDTEQKFWNYLHQAFGSTSGDNPDHFFRQAKADFKLPDQAWTDYYPSDRASVRQARYGDGGFPTVQLPRKKILDLVAANLRRNIPSVYCNPPHCMLIYGAVFNGTAVSQWAIGDSSGGYTYKKSASAVFNDVDLVVTMPPAP